MFINDSIPYFPGESSNISSFSSRQRKKRRVAPFEIRVTVQLFQAGVPLFAKVLPGHERASRPAAEMEAAAQRTAVAGVTGVVPLVGAAEAPGDEGGIGGRPGGRGGGGREVVALKPAGVEDVIDLIEMATDAAAVADCALVRQGAVQIGVEAFQLCERFRVHAVVLFTHAIPMPRAHPA